MTVKLKLGPNKVTNREYHSDREFFSSSVFKLINKDLENFHKKYVLKEEEEPQRSIAAFDEGSLVHAIILEPEVVNEEFAFYPGFQKRGKEFQIFKEQNSGKIIISESQRIRCKNYVESYKRRTTAVKLLIGGESEYTLCGIFAGLKVKTRFDRINIDDGYITDIKTTSYPVDVESFRTTMDQFGYKLSAALYLQIAEDFFKKHFEFYFVVIGKKDGKCEVYRLSDKSREEGMQDLLKSVAIYQKAKREDKWTTEIKLDRSREVGDYEILEV